MNRDDCSYIWKPVSGRQKKLIRAWERVILLRRFLTSLTYFAMVFLILSSLFFIPDMPCKKYLFFVLLFMVSGYGGCLCLVYEKEKKFWNRTIYARTMICVGITKIQTRRASESSLDIIGSEGELIEAYPVFPVILNAVRQQDKMLAITGEPKDFIPERIYPLHFPKKRTPIREKPLFIEP